MFTRWAPAVSLPGTLLSLLPTLADQLPGLLVACWGREVVPRRRAPTSPHEGQRPEETPPGKRNSSPSSRDSFPSCGMRAAGGAGRVLCAGVCCGGFGRSLQPTRVTPGCGSSPTPVSLFTCLAHKCSGNSVRHGSSELKPANRGCAVGSCIWARRGVYIDCMSR